MSPKHYGYAAMSHSMSEATDATRLAAEEPEVQLPAASVEPARPRLVRSSSLYKRETASPDGITVSWDWVKPYCKPSHVAFGGARNL